MLLFHWAGLRVRSPITAAMAVVLGFSILAMPRHADAHEGHDHGPAAASLPVTTNPRAAATGDEFEAVAFLKGGEFVIFADRFADNSPVTGATVTVRVGAQELGAKPQPDGSYRVAWPAIAKSGRHDLVIGIQDGATADLLITTLGIPATASALTAGTTPSLLERLKGWFSGSPLISALGALVIMLLAAALVLRRKLEARGETKEEAEAATTNPGADKTPKNLLLLAAILAGGMVLADRPAIAHEGEDHGGDAGKGLAVTGDAPRRLADGSVFLPKPTQRLLDVRTELVKEAPHRPSQTLVGRVIANPNRSGLVQSSTGGRITPPSTGLPRLGQAVKAGDVLAYVTPAFQAIDSANVGQTAGNLDQQIQLARTSLERAQRLLAANAGTRVQAEEAELTLRGLERRRAALNTSQIKAEPLVAPVDGVISSTHAVPGQVVAPQDVLFEIIDGRSLWVEALVF